MGGILGQTGVLVRVLFHVVELDALGPFLTSTAKKSGSGNSLSEGYRAWLL